MLLKLIANPKSADATSVIEGMLKEFKIRNQEAGPKSTKKKASEKENIGKNAFAITCTICL